MIGLDENNNFTTFGKVFLVCFFSSHAVIGISLSIIAVLKGWT